MAGQGLPIEGMTITKLTLLASITKHAEPHGRRQFCLLLVHVYTTTPANPRISIISGQYTMNK